MSSKQIDDRICPNCARTFFKQYVFNECSFCHIELQSIWGCFTLLNPGGVFYLIAESSDYHKRFKELVNNV